MKVLHVPYCFYPDPVGGTEIYVQALCRELYAQGVDSVVAAPGTENAEYEHEGTPVRRYAIQSYMRDLSDIYGVGDVTAAQNFGNLLDLEKPDLVHLHAFTSGVSMLILRYAKAKNIPVVLTYHTPTVTCMRGTLLRWGSENCDGYLDQRTCTQCQLDGLGVNRSVSAILTAMPAPLRQIASASGQRGKVWTAVRMYDLVGLRHQATHALFREADKIISLCDWITDLLLLNGVEKIKIVLSRHGLPDIGRLNLSNVTSIQKTLRLVYLGRIDPIKGLEKVIGALREMPLAEIELNIYGTVQPGNERYKQHLLNLAEGDSRIRFQPSVPRSEIYKTLAEHHFLVVPSQVCETGPLVVLEAFAAGVPVIGSNLGGIAELVDHQKSGLLVDPFSVGAWRDVLQLILDQPEIHSRLQIGITPPRSMTEVARDMVNVYHSMQHGR